MPHCFRMKHRPKAVPYNPSIQRNKAQTCPKLSHGIGQIHTIESTKRRPRYTNGKLESSRMRYLLVGVSRSTKNESKMQPKVAWGSKNRESRKPCSFRMRGEVFECRKRSPPSFFTFWCRGCSPRRANLPFFFCA